MVSSTVRICDASTPSTTRRSPCLMKGSSTLSATRSSARIDSRREIRTQSMMLASSSSELSFGGNTIQRIILRPSRKILNGVCNSTALIVPPITMMKAGSWSRAPRSPPSSSIATQMQAMAETSAARETMSIQPSRRGGVAPSFPALKRAAQHQQRAAVRAAHGRFVQAENLADLVHVQAALVIKRHDQLLAIWQRFDRARKGRHDSVLVQTGLGIVGAARQVVLAVHELVELEEADARNLDQKLVIGVEREAHRGGEFLVGGAAAEPAFEHAHRRGGLLGAADDAHRRPGFAPRLVDHRVADRAAQPALAEP